MLQLPNNLGRAGVSDENMAVFFWGGVLDANVEGQDLECPG